MEREKPTPNSKAMTKSSLTQELPQSNKGEVSENSLTLKQPNLKPKFYSEKGFAKNFIDTRKIRATNLQAHKIGDSTYLVYNPDNQKTYKVTAFNKNYRCNCKDFEKQAQFFKTPRCKHIYKVLEIIENQ